MYEGCLEQGGGGVFLKDRRVSASASGICQ